MLSKVIVPLVGISNPLIQRNKVLLPEPEGPIITATSLGFTLSVTSFNTSVFWNDLLIWSTLIK